MLNSISGQNPNAEYLPDSSSCHRAPLADWMYSFAVLPGFNDADHLVQQPVDLRQKGTMRRLMKDEPEYNRIAPTSPSMTLMSLKTMASARWSWPEVRRQLINSRRASCPPVRREKMITPAQQHWQNVMAQRQAGRMKAWTTPRVPRMKRC